MNKNVAYIDLGVEECWWVILLMACLKFYDCTLGIHVSRWNVKREVRMIYNKINRIDRPFLRLYSVTLISTRLWSFSTHNTIMYAFFTISLPLLSASAPARNFGAFFCLAGRNEYSYVTCTQSRKCSGKSVYFFFNLKPVYDTENIKPKIFTGINFSYVKEAHCPSWSRALLLEPTLPTIGMLLFEEPRISRKGQHLLFRTSNQSANEQL